MDSSLKTLLLIIFLFLIVNIIVHPIRKRLDVQRADLFNEARKALKVGSNENYYSSKGERKMSELKNIKLSKVAKATAVGGVGLLIATIAPLGVAAVGAITVGTAAASWIVDSVNDSVKKK